MLLATEANPAALYVVAREAVYIQIILEELDHKQSPTPLQTDNSMAEAVASGKVKSKRIKGNGHEVSLAQKQRMPVKIPHLLEAR